MTKEATPLKPKIDDYTLRELAQKATAAVNEGEQLASEMTEEDKQNAENISKFLDVIPQVNRSKFHAAIGSKEFINAFTQHSAESAEICVKVEHDGASTKPPINVNNKEPYAAFIVKQKKIAEESYKQPRREYATKNRFRKVNIPLQMFASGCQATSTPCLQDQTIDKVILHKDDHGNTPIA
jgi:hypothetical protein